MVLPCIVLTFLVYCPMYKSAKNVVGASLTKVKVVVDRKQCLINGLSIVTTCLMTKNYKWIAATGVCIKVRIVFWIVLKFLPPPSPTGSASVSKASCIGPFISILSKEYHCYALNLEIT